MREIRNSGSMRGRWKRSHGRNEAPACCESSREQQLLGPTATEPAPYSTGGRLLAYGSVGLRGFDLYRSSYGGRLRHCAGRRGSDGSVGADGSGRGLPANLIRRTRRQRRIASRAKRNEERGYDELPSGIILVSLGRIPCAVQLV